MGVIGSVDPFRMDAERHSRSYRRFLEGLNPAAIDQLNTLAAPDVHYHDPFVDARGLVAVKRVFHRLFDEVDAPRFTITHSACDGDTCFLRWHFTCRPKTIRKGHPWIVDGVTEVRFDAEGRVIEHIEHWDAGEQVYERMPVIRAVIRWVKRQVSA
jgi:steroid delta-isomerase